MYLSRVKIAEFSGKNPKFHCTKNSTTEKYCTQTMFHLNDGALDFIDENALILISSGLTVKSQSSRVKYTKVFSRFGIFHVFLCDSETWGCVIFFWYRPVSFIYKQQKKMIKNVFERKPVIVTAPSQKNSNRDVFLNRREIFCSETNMFLLRNKKVCLWLPVLRYTLTPL